MSDDDDANLQWVQCWYGRVHALCQSKLRFPADAEDATQETFLRGIARINELKSPDAIGAWLRGIAHNVCVDVIRRSEVRKSSNRDVANLPTPGMNEEITSRDEQAFLIRLVHDLPEQSRETVLLHYYEDMTYDEMASWLGVARSTVNERLSKARRLLKNELLSRQVL
jgi:RNA polymerase sigma-70 factor (ECF subfamily)